jgi:PadR family transcriptional regulator, regulatory protein AphA
MNSRKKNSKPYERNRNPTEYLVLGALAGGPLHGYDLYQYLEEHLGRIWNLGRSQTYALLSRMEQAGLVTHERQAQEKRPDRKVFSLTSTGRKKFKAWVKTPVEHVRDLRLEFLAKIHFLGQGDRKLLEKLIDAQQEICRDKITRMAERNKSASPEMELLAYDFRMSQAQAAIEWLEQIKSRSRK